MTAPFALDNRMTVVLFAGMGGGCDGLEAAGFPVHVAINHDPVAVAVHRKRHPHTLHLTCDVFEADPRAVTRGRGVRILHASPDCTHFSVAKGGKPVSKRRRSLAWIVCRWAGTVRPETITLENVYEIQSWGPLIAKRDPATGRVLRLDGAVAGKGERVPVTEQWLIPDPRRKGRVWRAWLKHMAGLGYRFEGRVLVCADYGVPTIRKRFFGVARRDGEPVVWRERTHAPRRDAKRLKLRPWVGMHTCIDWSLPVRSIFGRPKPLAEATLRRTARSVMRHVVTAAEPFIVETFASRAEGAPAGRATTPGVRSDASLLAPSMAVMRNSREPTYAANDPAHAFTAGGANHALIAAFMAHQNRAGRDAREPGAALMAGGNHAGLILAFLQNYYSADRTGSDIAGPLGAVTTKARHGLVTVTVTVRGEDYVLTDIAMRMIEPEEGAAAHGFAPGSLPDVIEIDGKPRRLTKTEKYCLVGNSVPPAMVRMLAEDNVRRELAMEAAE